VATFIQKTLDGANFFKEIRQNHMANSGEWMFAGVDGDLKYVVMDSLFFRLMCVIRPDGHYFPNLGPALRFTQHAIALTSGTSIPRFRVVVNGNFYDNSNYHWTAPAEARGWKGELIQAGNLIPSPPISPNAGFMGSHHFIGRNGQRTGRYHCEGSLPSLFGDPLANPSSPFSMLTFAMGGLLPMIVRKKIHPTLSLSASEKLGKTIVGYHQATESLFVVSQERVIISDGVSLSDIANRLKNTGVDVALQCDASTSSALVVDGTIQVDCAFGKDCTTPNGLGFQFANPKLGGQGSALSVSGGPQNIPNFDASLTASSGKLTLAIKSFGSSQAHTPSAIAASLSISGTAIPSTPLNLEATLPGSIDLQTGVTFKSAAFGSPLKTVECSAKLHTQSDIDELVGTIKVIQNGTTVKSATFACPILA
jgi:hypothetical protein